MKYVAVAAFLLALILIAFWINLAVEKRRYKHMGEAASNIGYKFLGKMVLKDCPAEIQAPRRTRI